MKTKIKKIIAGTVILGSMIGGVFVVDRIQDNYEKGFSDGQETSKSYLTCFITEGQREELENSQQKCDEIIIIDGWWEKS